MSDLTTVGLDCKLYYNTGSYAAPSWELVPNVKDVNYPSQFGEAVGSTRSSTVVEVKPTLQGFELTFNLRRNKADAVYEVFRAAHYARTTIEVLALDALEATAGAEGPRFTAYVMGFDEAEPLEEFSEVAVTLKPAAGAANALEWYTVST